jgi:hypothetical protein
MKVMTGIFLPCHLVGDLLLMKVETHIFLLCHLVGDLLD